MLEDKIKNCVDLALTLKLNPKLNIKYASEYKEKIFVFFNYSKRENDPIRMGSFPMIELYSQAACSSFAETLDEALDHLRNKLIYMLDSEIKSLKIKAADITKSAERMAFYLKEIEAVKESKDENIYHPSL